MQRSCAQHSNAVRSQYRRQYELGRYPRGNGFGDLIILLLGEKEFQCFFKGALGRFHPTGSQKNE